MKGQITLSIEISDATKAIEVRVVELPYNNYQDMTEFFLDSVRRGLAESQYVSGWTLVAI